MAWGVRFETDDKGRTRIKIDSGRKGVTKETTAARKTNAQQLTPNFENLTPDQRNRALTAALGYGGRTSAAPELTTSQVKAGGVKPSSNYASANRQEMSSTGGPVGTLGVPQWFRDAQTAERNSLSTSSNTLPDSMLAPIPPIVSIPGLTPEEYAAKQAATGQQALMDWLMGKDIQGPQLNLPQQGPLPDINFSDLLAPYQGAITGANDMVQQAISASASQNAAQNAALRSQLQTNYSDTAQQYGQAAQGAQQNIANMANSYGVGQALTGTGGQQAAQQDARMQGLFAAQQAGGLSSLDVLSNMKNQSFDVAKNLAAGYGAQNLSQLANTLSNADIQEELTRRQNENDLSLAGIQAQAEMAKLGAGMRGDEQNRRFDIWKTLSDMELAQQKAAEANLPEVTRIDKMGDPQLRATVDSITDPDVKRAVVDAINTSSSPAEAVEKLHVALVAPSTDPLFASIGNAIGTAAKGKLLPKQALAAAIQLLDQYNLRTGGTSSQYEIKTKGSLPAGYAL